MKLCLEGVVHLEQERVVTCLENHLPYVQTRIFVVIVIKYFVNVIRIVLYMVAAHPSSQEIPLKKTVHSTPRKALCGIIREEEGEEGAEGG